MKNIKLNTGYTIPQIGLGTWRITGKEHVKEIIKNAIDVGYRHIDTALVYENEKDIGDALKEIYAEGKIKRADLFITSKLWNTYHENVKEGLEQTLKDLQTDYLDLYLVHWPVKFEKDQNFNGIYVDDKPKLLEYDVLKVWKQMECVVKAGKVRSIGIANHGIKNVTKILENCEIKPAVCQFELHPHLQQKELVKFCNDKDLNIIAYSSLGSLPETRKQLMEDPVLLEISKRYNKPVTCIILNWIKKKNIVVIPKASSKKHMEENLCECDLSEEDSEKIDKINKNVRFVELPEFGPKRFD